jgi:hypothetical protein
MNDLPPLHVESVLTHSNRSTTIIQFSGFAGDPTDGDRHLFKEVH